MAVLPLHYHMGFLMKLLRSVLLSFLPLIGVLSPAAHADTVLVQGAGVSVTTADVAADALTKIPADARAAALSRPVNVNTLATDLYVQRVQAAEAEKMGLTSDPEVAAALRLAHDKVLSQAKMIRTEKANLPTEAAMDAYAQMIYKANPEHFRTASERWNVSHILIKADTPDARVKAEKVLAELKAGAKFDDLARQYSDDAGSSGKGGSLGYLEEGKVIKSFAAALQALKMPGDISDIVETPAGLHIIRLDGHRDAGVKPFDEVRDELRAEAQSKLLLELRLREQKRILETAQFDQAAIDAYAASQAK